jgi:hypothetical protein
MSFTGEPFYLRDNHRNKKKKHRDANLAGEMKNDDRSLAGYVCAISVNNYFLH